MKDIIISLAVNGRDAYQDNLPKLKESIQQHYSGEYRLYTWYPDYVRPHTIIPYAFKFDIINKLKNDGYERVIWLDSTMRLNKDPFELFENTMGVVLFHNVGHPLYKYISDEAVINLLQEDKIERSSDIHYIKQVWGGCFGLDLTKIVAKQFINSVNRQIELGSFNDGISTREGFVSHRNDQSCMSVLASFYRIELKPYGVIAAPKDVNEETVIIYGDN